MKTYLNFINERINDDFQIGDIVKINEKINFVNNILNNTCNKIGTIIDKVRLGEEYFIVEFKDKITGLNNFIEKEYHNPGTKYLKNRGLYNCWVYDYRNITIISYGQSDEYEEWEY